MHIQSNSPRGGRESLGGHRRRGAVAVFVAILVVFLIACLAFSIDIGYMMAVQGEMDRAVDAAALAGAGNLVDGVDAANLAALDVLLCNAVGRQVLLDSEDRQAKLMAWLAEHEEDFETEAGEWDPQTRVFSQTEALPSAIRVCASYEHPTLFFARVIGVNSFEVKAEAIARYQPRDIALVLDFSGSMNDDSELRRIHEYGEGSREAVETNLLEIYEDLGSPVIGDLQFEPVYISSADNSVIKQTLGINDVAYPYPSGSWNDYINYVKSYYNYPAKADYRKKYGFLTLINYWLERKPKNQETPDLWKVSAQPIGAVKDTVGVFMEYVQEVDCDDRVALVIYNSPSQEALLEQALTTDFVAVEDIVRDRQAAHYDNYTNIGAGIREGWQELQRSGRAGAKKMIVLMTDGIANRPGGTTSGRQYALDQAAEAAGHGYPIVTISLGNAADTALMEEIAQITHGTHFNVPGGSDVTDYEEALLAVFRTIADARPLLLVQ